MDQRLRRSAIRALAHVHAPIEVGAQAGAVNAAQTLDGDGVLGRYVANALPATERLLGQAQRIQHDLAPPAGSEHLVNEIGSHASILFRYFLQVNETDTSIS